MLVKRIVTIPYYFQPYLSNSTRRFKSSLFQYIFAHSGLPRVRPQDNRGKCQMDGKMIQCWSSAWQHIPIYMYLQPFTSYSEIYVGNCNFFLYPLHLTPPLGCSHWNSGKKFGPQKTRIMGSEDSLTIGCAVLTQYQRVTDRRTDRRPAYSYNVRSMTDAR